MAAASARIRAQRQRGSPPLSPDCCILKLSPRDAPSRNAVRRRSKEAFAQPVQSRPANRAAVRAASAKPWARMEQALRAADLLLQAGGFAAIVLDMAGIAPECATRVPMATWFRYRAAAERTQASLLLLTQSPCAKSSAELLLRFAAGRRARAMRPQSSPESSIAWNWSGSDSRRSDRMSSPCASRRSAKPAQTGAASAHGQVRDEQARRVLCLRLRQRSFPRRRCCACGRNCASAPAW